MSWTQPCCEPCWDARHPTRVPTRLKEPEKEKCCYCGCSTRSGIYVRENPALVPYPRKEED